MASESIPRPKTGHGRRRLPMEPQPAVVPGYSATATNYYTDPTAAPYPDVESYQYPVTQGAEVFMERPKTSRGSRAYRKISTEEYGPTTDLASTIPRPKTSKGRRSMPQTMQDSSEVALSAEDFFEVGGSGKSTSPQEVDILQLEFEDDSIPPSYRLGSRKRSSLSDRSMQSSRIYETQNTSSVSSPVASYTKAPVTRKTSVDSRMQNTVPNPLLDEDWHITPRGKRPGSSHFRVLPSISQDKHVQKSDVDTSLHQSQSKLSPRPPDTPATKNTVRKNLIEARYNLPDRTCSIAQKQFNKGGSSPKQKDELSYDTSTYSGAEKAARKIDGADVVTHTAEKTHTMQKQKPVIAKPQVSHANRAPGKENTGSLQNNKVARSDSSDIEASGQIMLAVKLPSGERVQKSFRVTDPLRKIIEFAEISAGENFSGWELVSQGPMKVFSNLTQTIQMAGLSNRTLLYIQQPDDD